MIHLTDSNQYRGSAKRRIRRHGLRSVGVGVALGLVLGVVVIASPLGRGMDRQLTAHFSVMNRRRVEQRTTLFDRVQCYLLYNGIAVGGRVVSWEGGQVIWSYLHGGGQDLWLCPDYIMRSKVIRRSLAQLREGQSQRFTFSQGDDFRLSMAVNPFHLKRTNGKVLLWQRIQFENDLATYTTLDYGVGSFRLPDGLIHVLHPQPFTVYAQWNDPSQ